MYRTRPRTVVLLVAVTGLAVGFAHLENARPPTPAPAVQAAEPAPDHSAEEAAQVRSYFEDMARYLNETEAAPSAPVVLPPLSQLPPLPSELLPETAPAPGSDPTGQYGPGNPSPAQALATRPSA